MEAKYSIINGRSLPISFKASVEICSSLRHKPVKKAKTLLEQVIQMKQPIPFKRFRKETPHRRGKLAEGRYPIKASKEILKLLKSVEASALHQGLSANLAIQEIKANQGPLQWHYGRQRRTRHKRTHILIRIAEQQAESKEKKKVTVHKSPVDAGVHKNPPGVL